MNMLDMIVFVLLILCVASQRDIIKVAVLSCCSTFFGFIKLFIKSVFCHRITHNERQPSCYFAVLKIPS